MIKLISIEKLGKNTYKGIINVDGVILEYKLTKGSELMIKEKFVFALTDSQIKVITELFLQQKYE